MGGVEITGIPDNTVDETIWTGITNNNYLDWIHVTDRCDIYLQHFQHFAYIHTQSETKTFLREEKRFSGNLWKLSSEENGVTSLLSHLNNSRKCRFNNPEFSYQQLSQFFNGASTSKIIYQTYQGFPNTPKETCSDAKYLKAFIWEGKYIHLQGNYIHRIETAAVPM